LTFEVKINETHVHTFHTLAVVNITVGADFRCFAVVWV
jgi:hypothetical protein